MAHARQARALRIAALCGLVSVILSSHVYAFKPGDFKRCSDVRFCRELLRPDEVEGKVERDGLDVAPRNHPGGVFQVTGNVVVGGDGIASAKVADGLGSEFTLSITPLKGNGGVRVHMSQSGGRNRFDAAPYVFDLSVPWSERMGGWHEYHEESNGRTALQVNDGGGPWVVLNHSPLRIEFNGTELDVLAYETGTSAGEAETWKSHVDSKPHGNEGLLLHFAFPGAEAAYGLPEHASPFALRPTCRRIGMAQKELPQYAGDADAHCYSEPYRLYNLDVFEYDEDSSFGLYGSVPMLVTHSLCATAGQACSNGVLWANAAEMFVEVAYSLSADENERARSAEVWWVAEAGLIDLTLTPKLSFKKVVQSLAALTGPAAMPQLFSTAYHQCRWNYRDEADVRSMDYGFDNNETPYDVLWLDIEHTDGKKYMTWDKNAFPNTSALFDELGQRRRKVVAIIDPHVKRDKNYPIFEEATSKKFFVQDSKGADFDGWCWPGSSSYLDVMDARVREWWASKFELQAYEGSTRDLYVWNDMNEPSVFNGPEITMPKDALHLSGTVEHREVHNVYGMMYHAATAEGLNQRGRTGTDSKRNLDGDRPFVLSRAFFAGSQRYGAVWTGDNKANWEHLRLSIPMLLSISVSGIPHAGADVGGFFGNPEPELLLRWYQLGAMYPFFRGHAHLETLRREPWLGGEPWLSLNREAIQRRYALLPLFYTLFFDAHTEAVPVMRPLIMEFPHDRECLSQDKAFMIGSELLVWPVLERQQTEMTVYLPLSSDTGDALLWYEYEPRAGQTEKVAPRVGGFVTISNLQLGDFPTFLRGGSIIPRRDRMRRSSLASSRDPYTLVIALDQAGAARGKLYADDGETNAFLLRQEFVLQRMTAISKDGILTISGKADGKAGANKLSTKPPPPFSQSRIERIIIEGKREQLGTVVGIESGGWPLDIQHITYVGGTHSAHRLVVKTVTANLKVSSDWTLRLIF